MGHTLFSKPSLARRVARSQAREEFKRFIAGRAVGVPPPPLRRLTDCTYLSFLSMWSYHTRRPRAVSSSQGVYSPLSGLERTHIGNTESWPALKQGEHAPFH